MDATEGRVQFHTRVAVNALRMVERELGVEPPSSPPPHCRPRRDRRRRDLAAAHPRRLPRRPVGRGASRSSRDGASEAPGRRIPAYLRRRRRVASGDADRDLECQLAEGAPAARRGIPRLRRRRRALPAGDQDCRQDVPCAVVLGARLRQRASRTGAVERRCHPVSHRAHGSHQRLRRQRSSIRTKAMRASSPQLPAGSAS